MMPRYRLIVAPLLLTLLLTSLAAAQDAVKIGGFWIDNVAIQGVVEGQLVYQASGGGEVTQPMDKVEGVKLGKYPALALAQAALEAGNDAEAIKQLLVTLGAAKEPWLQRYSSKLLMEAADRDGKADQAIDAFIALATTPGIDEFYLTNPPTASVAAADEKTKQTIKQKLATAQAKLPTQGSVSEMAAALAGLVASAGEAVPSTAPGDSGEPLKSDAPPVAPRVEEPPAVVSATVLPSFIDDDAITKLLRAGQYEEAVDLASKAMLSAGDLSLKLYQHGKAKLGLADAAMDDETAQKLYKDAGLSFMRVVIYFPTSPYQGAALVEAGYVHQKVGRNDIARRLYQAADLALGEPSESPQYFERLRELNESLAGQ